MAQTIALIPARRDSVRVIKKNIKPLLGIPLIDYTFIAAKKAKFLDKIIVSTNDTEILPLANKYGIEVPFIRPDSLALDNSTDFDWINHAYYKMLELGFSADIIVILRPTSPFRPDGLIDKVVKKLIKNDLDSIRTLTKVKHHPYWMKIRDGKTVKPYVDLGIPDEKLRSQDLPELFRLNGCVDVIRSSNLHNDKLYGDSMGYEILGELESFDIDTENDFRLCEIIMKNILKI